MARLASQAKMGYYPTPATVLALIKKMLKSEDPSNCAALDPCCGTGEFAQAMPDDVVTYGNELNEDRFEIAKENLDHTIYGDGLWDVKTTNMAYSCLWLNPPYDWGHSIEGNKSERMELQFLKATTKYLVRKGLLIFIIPKDTLYHCAEYLAFNYKEIKVFPFPDDEFKAFEQIVIFATRSQGKDDQTVSDLKELGNWNLYYDPLPLKKLNEVADEKQFILPAAKEIKGFKTTRLNPKELAKIVEASDLKVDPLFHVQDQVSIRVPMPLHKGHLAMLLASGYMNGEFKSLLEWYLVKGATKKSVIKIEEEKVVRQRDKIEIVLKALDLNREKFIEIK